MTHGPGHPGAWDALADELDGDRDAVARFVAAWAQALGPRLRRVHAALAAGDVDDAEVALLTVRCTSTMVGAHAVAELASGALDALRAADAEVGGADGAGAGPPAVAVRHLADLATAAVEAVARTGAVLPGWRADGAPSAAGTTGRTGPPPEGPDQVVPSNR
ncbi:hypothetical protein [Cellulosimicrobium sp. NPDC057127]|uniref:hypothetical protein n=1 Tax=Cellulosimicrobium sp. NPDC057127 TaxID=3346026 RepID=UPI0036388C71